MSQRYTRSKDPNRRHVQIIPAAQLDPKIQKHTRQYRAYRKLNNRHWIHHVIANKIKSPIPAIPHKSGIENIQTNIQTTTPKPTPK